MRIPRFLATAALAAALVAAPLTVSAASAAPTAHHVTAPNVLGHLCGHGASAGHPCSVLVQRADGDEVLKVRDSHGHVLRFTDSRHALRYLKRHATPCAEEDSDACYWDASARGNGVGDSFIVIGHGEWVRDRSLPQYGHGVLVYLGDLD